MKALIKKLLAEAIKSGHWHTDSYPIRIETSTLKDMDPIHRQEIDKRLKFIESLEFSNKQPQKIGVWVYETPKEVLHHPYKPIDKGSLLLAIINNNNMTTLYWKHKFEGQYDYDIKYKELVEFAASDFYDAKTNPITIKNLQAFNKSKRVVQPSAPRTDKFKKIKLANGNIVRYYEALTKFETLEGKPIDNNDIFDELPEELQDKVLASINESVIGEEAVKNLSIEVYHGSPHEITSFRDEFVGGKEATDQEGPGLYFTTSYEEALAYAGNKGEGFIYKAKINPRLLYGDDTGKRTIPIGKLNKLVMMANNWKDNAQNFAENPLMGVRKFLSGAYDYNDSDKDTLLQVWIDFYRYEGREFVRNCVKVGIDGVIVNRYEKEGKNIIIYNPSVIELLKKEPI
jgi:hypothetical protein